MLALQADWFLKAVLTEVFGLEHTGPETLLEKLPAVVYKLGQALPASDLGRRSMQAAARGSQHVAESFAPRIPDEEVADQVHFISECCRHKSLLEVIPTRNSKAHQRPAGLGKGKITLGLFSRLF